MNGELNLLKKRKKGLLRIIFSRTGIIILLLLLAVGCFLISEIFFAALIGRILGGLGLFNLCVIVYLINSDMDSSAKLTWILVISVTSFFGTIFYIYTKSDVGSRAIGTGYNKLVKDHKREIQQDNAVMEDLNAVSRETAELVRYLDRSGTYPATAGNKVTYYPLGENKWEAMLEELKKAEKFIFMEYFIIDEGKMWGSILHVLAEKAKQGVEVRVMYDGTCAIALLPYNYPKMLAEYGIKCKMFSPIRPFLSTHYNYRDHRKILVIDGKVGFNGGVNLADEYINHTSPYGHWKDTAVKIEGKAVDNLTLMFLNMWSLGERNPDYQSYLGLADTFEEKGYAVPFGDNPFDNDKVGEKVYMDILNRANNYVHIMTPYLILDDELLTALKYSAERGIDTKLILPGIPDKKPVYALAKTYFKTLLDSGVEIYLYTPGFVHAKVFVSDGIKAVVGTINLDYRSLYHHFECGTYLYGADCIADIEADFADALKKCEKVTYESIKKEKGFTKIMGRFMRLIAPLL
ncbi:MAG: cardiolipin synthase [Ruminococcus sp.]|nr:cardiolipin synthase [Ruminococcus sp.]MCM1380813.1 cardiolipin synthase [Muribaculaceae bacterium]MCM1479606.1 cardiolipin synthase [Muribaculaceae bacterium]